MPLCQYQARRPRRHARLTKLASPVLVLRGAPETRLRWDVTRELCSAAKAPAVRPAHQRRCIKNDYQVECLNSACNDPIIAKWLIEGHLQHQNLCKPPDLSPDTASMKSISDYFPVISSRQKSLKQDSASLVGCLAA